MDVMSQTPHASQEAQIAADFPVTFAGTVGLFRPSDSPLSPIMPHQVCGASGTGIAVLFVSSWGFEELCARKFWQRLAIQLSQRGLASLRFDFPGTGDALEHPDAGTGLGRWLDTIGAAARTLKDLSGCDRVILIGHGIGAALAWKAAEEIDGVEGLAMAAPALSGRQWLREFVALSRIANQNSIQHTKAASGPAMGEQILQDDVAAGLRALNIASAPKAPAPRVLLLQQDNRPADAAFAGHLATLGVELQARIFEGYDKFIRDVLFSVPPAAAIDVLADWAGDVSARVAVPLAKVRRPVPSPMPLQGNGFRETPVRFGGSQRLYGILSEPTGPRLGATVLVISTGYDRMSGWGRITTRLCRDLARAGYPALRFDMANMADSPVVPSRPDQIIYSEGQLEDVDAALDFLEHKRLFPVVVTGRCSGGWVAFRSAVRNKRLSGVVPVNVFDFYIPKDADVEALLISSRQPLTSYGAKMVSGGFWRRVLRGEVRVKNGVVNLWAMIVGKAISVVTPIMVRFPFLSQRFKSLSDDFRTIAENDISMTVVYTEGDIGAATLETNFGSRGRLLAARYGSPKLVFIPDADHNLTTAHAREAWTAEVMEIARRYPPEG